MPPLATILLRGLLAAAAAAALAGRAQAAIVCDGPYQVIHGSTHATPLCEDRYLAQVARSYGMRVSDSQIAWNPNTKVDVCRTIGHDSRVSHICAGLRNEGRRGR